MFTLTLKIKTSVNIHLLCLIWKNGTVVNTFVGFFTKKSIPLYFMQKLELLWMVPSLEYQDAMSDTSVTHKEFVCKNIVLITNY